MIDLNKYYVSTEYQGASGGSEGRSGFVPKALSGDELKFLRGDGTWREVSGAYLPLSGGTIIGNISATGTVFAFGGNSANWNSTYTTTQANTATDSFDLSYTGTLPVPLTPIYTTNPLRDALLGASGSQAATYRDGKWITGLSITGYNNPTIDNLISLSSTNIVGIRDSFGLSNLTRLTTLNFPALASVGGSFTGNSGGNTNSLTNMSFPALASVGGSFIGNSAFMNSLTNMSFPALASVGGSFIGNGNGSNTNSLTNMSFPALASVGGAFTLNNGSMNSLTTLSFPALASVGGAFTLNSFTGSANSLTTFLLSSNLKHINGDFSSGNIGINLDRHNAWSANTYYPSATSFTAPASAFSSTTTGTTCSAAITSHGLQTNDIITVFGITSTTAATHNFNVVAVAVTRIDANNFSYTITATTQIPTGTATILRQEVAVIPITKNGRKYICTGAGTSGGTEPTWPTTIGQTVADGTATWTCSEMSLPNILSRLNALSGTNQTTTYGANRFINIGPTTLITVNSISTTAGVATITTATNHGITTGTQVVLLQCAVGRYNGVWTVASTGLTTLTASVPTDLNGVAPAGIPRLTTSCPQYTGSFPISATTVTGISADSHMIFSGTGLRDADGGTALPIFVAGIYNRNGTTNGFAKYSCTENGWDIWYDTTSKRWVNSPSQFTGNAAIVQNYAHTPQSVPLASTSSANPAVITSSVNHGIATGATFTVAIEGCSNAALNGSWTATSTGTATFTIPVDGSGGATTSSGTVAVLNQTFNQGILMTGGVASPIQGVEQTITTALNHGFSTEDFIHFYGASGTHEASIRDTNTSATVKSVTTAITVDNATTFRCIRYANTQPFIGSYSLTTMPHMRKPSVNDIAYYTTLKLRARGLAVSLVGTTGA